MVRTCLGDWLKLASRRLDSVLEAELLLGRAISRTRAWLYAHPEQVLSEDQLDAARAMLDRRLAGEPIAYILGSREFWGREFQVNPDVLIPRPETELLVELALALDCPARARVLDIGTGSGCIILTLAAERPDWQCAGSDASEAALRVAAANRARLGLEGVELFHGELFAPVAGRRFDLIVSNPPYVASGDAHLGRGDLRFEPMQALVAADQGMHLLQRIITESRNFLAADGWLLLEHGHDQSASVLEALREAGFVHRQSHLDLAGIRRAASGRLAPARHS